MFWAASLFNVVEYNKKDKLIWFDINTQYSIQNIKWLKQSDYYIYAKKIVKNFDNMSLDDQINALEKNGQLFKKETLRLIDEGKFNKIKFNKRKDLFWIHKDNIKHQGFCFDDKNMKLLNNKNNIKEYDLWSDESKKLNTKNMHRNIYKKTLINGKKNINIEAIDIRSGLSIIGSIDKFNFIYDCGCFNEKRTPHAKKITEWFDRKGIKNINIFISHEHLDHYSIATTLFFRNWISKKNATIYFHDDYSNLSLMKLINACKHKIILERNQKIKIGPFNVQTFEWNPKNTKYANESSFIMNGEKVTLTGDQKYFNIPNDWKINQKYFQVPHHGSKNSGDFRLAKNNKENILPSGIFWNLPDKNVKKHFEKSKKIKKMY